MASICLEEKVFSQFLSSLRVLAIDTDPTILEFIKKICDRYRYQVITCTESLRAANILRERKTNIHLVLMEVHMPNMDGYDFLLANEEINVPVIMMSLDGNKSSVMKTIKLGACDYWIKPLQEDRLKNMWTHVAKKFMSENKMQKYICSLEDDNQKRMISDNSELVFSSAVESPREVDDVGECEKCDPSPRKKYRVVWTLELHRKFVEAVNQLGLANAVPNKILELMNLPGLTRNHVASHLQKYRNTLKTKSNIGEKQRQPRNEMSRTIEPTGADLHAGLIGNMVAKREHQSASDNPFHAEQALGLANGDPLVTYLNTAILHNFPQSMGTLDDAYRHGIWSPYNTVLAENQVMLQSNNALVDTLQQQQQQQQMQQSLMQHQIHPINFHDNPYLVIQNDNFGRNIDHRRI